MFFNMGYNELLIIGVLAIVLFGKNLPDVARRAGTTYRQLRKTLSEMQAQFQLDDDITSPPSSNSYDHSSYQDDYDSYEPPSGEKYEPPALEDKSTQA